MYLSNIYHSVYSFLSLPVKAGWDKGEEFPPSPLLFYLGGQLLLKFRFSSYSIFVCQDVATAVRYSVTHVAFRLFPKSSFVLSHRHCDAVMMEDTNIPAGRCPSLNVLFIGILIFQFYVRLTLLFSKPMLFTCMLSLHYICVLNALPFWANGFRHHHK